MSLPREIIPGAIYFLTRRCTQRMFLLRPDRTTNEIFAYCLAVAAKRCKIGVIAWLAMSNHYHAVVHDPEGRLPEFLAYFHKLVAKVFNRRWGRWENFWSTEETCVTRLVTKEDVFDKVVYTLANPLAANVADRLCDWPGHSALDHLDGKPKQYDRPGLFFSESGSMAEVATLRCIRPPMLPASETQTAWAARVRKALRAAEVTARAERQRTRTKVVSRKRVLAARETDAPLNATTHRKLRPALACKDAERRILELGKLKAFRIAHREARLRFKKGDRKVKFPTGTYQLVKELRVHCVRLRN